MTQWVTAPANPSSAYVDEYWNNLTDAELLKVPWFIDDPKTLPGIEAAIPDDLGEFQVEIEYKLDHSDQPVPCAHCPQHTPHWHGFVLKTPEGQRYLLGSVCGPKAYGADYRVAANARRKAKERYDALTKWHSYRHRLPDLIEALEDTTKEAGFKAVRRARAQLHNHAETLVRRLGRLRPNHMTGLVDIVVVTRTRDVAAEKQRDDQFQKEADAIAHLGSKKHREAMAALCARLRPYEEIVVTQERDLGSLPPIGWLADPDSPIKQVEDATARLRGYLAVGRQTEGKPVALLKSWSRHAQVDIELAVAALGKLRQAGAFFTSINLERLVEWDRTNAAGSLGIVSRGTGLFLSAKHDEAAISLGASWSAPGNLYLELSD